MARWPGRTAEHAPVGVLTDGDRAVSPPAVRFGPPVHPAVPFDPLVHPVAITGQCVIGDQIRVPAAWCAMADCGAAYSDPAALGEADNRARALAAGWATDALGRLVCPGCQVTHPVPAWWVPPRQPGTAGSRGAARGPSWPAGGTSQTARPAAQPGLQAAGVRRPAAAQDRHHRTQWPRLLSTLAGANGDKPRHVNAG